MVFFSEKGAFAKPVAYPAHVYSSEGGCVSRMVMRAVCLSETCNAFLIRQTGLLKAVGGRRRFLAVGGELSEASLL